MKNKLIVSLLFISMFSLTGCLEEILASLCSKMASDNSIVTVFQTTNDYSGRFAKLTYSRLNNLDQVINTYEVSDCNNNFSFPAGERKAQGGVSVSFVSILDEAGDSFFFDAGGVIPPDDKFQVSVEWYNTSDCSDVPSAPVVSSAAALDWSGSVPLPPEFGLIGECEITGQSAAITLSE